MRFWTNGGFFSSVKGHVIKWWQLVIMPVLHINNDKRMKQNVTQQSAQAVQPNQMMQQADSVTQTYTAEVQATPPGRNQSSLEETTNGMSTQGQTISSEQKTDAMEMQGNPTNSESIEEGDAMEVLRRINEEKEEKRRQDVENARKKAQEEARIAAIMNANKVDVNAFIEAGRVAKEEIANKKAEDDALHRAQEIMDRLNQEAAEDDAKKIAEIEVAKQEAKKRFG